MSQQIIYEDLPPELQTKIFSYRFPSDADLSTPALRSSRLVNRQFRDIADLQYSRRICTKPITKKEITDYLKTEPTLFGIYLPNVMGFSGFNSPVSTLYITCFNSGREINETSTYEINSSDIDYYFHSATATYFNYFPFAGLMHELIKPGKHNFDYEDIIEKYLNPSIDRVNDAPELDLLSTFRILSSRLWCNRINPDYAREYVREQFRGHLVDPEAIDVYDLCICHLYLVGTCRVLNLRIPRYDGLTGQLDQNEVDNFAETWVKDPKNLGKPRSSARHLDSVQVRNYGKILLDLEYLRSISWTGEEHEVDNIDIKIIKSQIPILAAKIEKAIDGFQMD